MTNTTSKTYYGNHGKGVRRKGSRFFLPPLETGGSKNQYFSPHWQNSRRERGGLIDGSPIGTCHYVWSLETVTTGTTSRFGVSLAVTPSTTSRLVAPGRRVRRCDSHQLFAGCWLLDVGCWPLAAWLIVGCPP